jgi:hypothetical protein
MHLNLKSRTRAACMVCVVRASMALPPRRPSFCATCGVTFNVAALVDELRRVESLELSRTR